MEKKDETPLLNAIRGCDWTGVSFPREATVKTARGRRVNGKSRRRFPLQRRARPLARLKRIPWWDPAEIPATALLEKNYKAIRDEFLNAVLCGLLRLHPQSKGGPSKQVADGDWNIFELFSRGKVNVQNAILAPHTVWVLQQLPEVTSHPCGFAYFSVLSPHTHITPHCGPTTSRIRVHLGLRVPTGASMRVGRETRSWKEGACSVFDDSWEHEVFNASDFLRAVLLVDVWHPDLTMPQRSRLVTRISSRVRYDEKVNKGRKGWLNVRATELLAGPPLLSLVGPGHLRKMITSIAKTKGSGHRIFSTLYAFASGSMDRAGAVQVGTAPNLGRELWAGLVSLVAERRAEFSPEDVVNIIHLGCAYWRTWPANQSLLWKFMKRAELEVLPLRTPGRFHNVREVLQWCRVHGDASGPFGAIAALAVVAIRGIPPSPAARPLRR